MYLASALLFAFAGWVALGLALDKHHRQVWRRAPGRAARIALRLAGAALLALAFAAAVAALGWSIGPTTWFGVIGATVLVFVLLLPYAPRRLAWGGLIAALLGLALAILAAASP